MLKEIPRNYLILSVVFIKMNNSVEYTTPTTTVVDIIIEGVLCASYDLDLDPDYGNL